MARTLVDFPTNLVKAFENVTLKKKYKIIGSSILKAKRFVSDYDINQEIRPSPEDILELFERAFKTPNTYISDFKAGGLKWTYEDVKRGRIKNMTLAQALQMNDTIKIDSIQLLNGLAEEITNNFITEKETDPIKSLKEAIRECVHEKLYFKSLKRIFSLRTIEGKPTKDLLDFFNSSVGLLNKVRSDLDLLVVLIQQSFKPVSLAIIRHNLQHIKYDLSAVASIDLSPTFNSMCKLKSANKLILEIQRVSDLINTEVEKEAYDFL